jgi:undecaprenyl diphosphate synthase
MGVKAVKQIVENCARRGVGVLTLFAFSSENWRRPRKEVSMLMGRFLDALDNEVAELHGNGIRCASSDGSSNFPRHSENACSRRWHSRQAIPACSWSSRLPTAGRWDIAAAAQELARRCVAGEMGVEAVDEAALGRAVALADLPDPDLLIRTGGEQRISNFLLWNLAYTELYFCDTAVAGLRRQRAGCRHRAFPAPPAAFRPHARTGGVALMLRQRVITALILAPLALLVILWVSHAVSAVADGAAGAGRRLGMVGLRRSYTPRAAIRLRCVDRPVRRGNLDTADSPPRPGG